MKFNNKEMESLKGGKMVVVFYEECGDKKPYTKTIFYKDHYQSVYREMNSVLCNYIEVYYMKDNRIVKEELTKKDVDSRI